MRQKKLAQRAASAALAACMMFTLSAPALAESTNALMQMSINSRSSIARLNEENSIVNSVNYADILGDGALSYDKNTNTLSLNKSYTDDGPYIKNLTINAPNTIVDLNGGIYSALQGKLVIEDAADVTLTSTESRAVFGDANITCTGKLRITCESLAVDGNLTVNNASSVELIGKNGNGLQQHWRGDHPKH